MVWWHLISGSWVPVQLCSEGRSELMVLDGVGARSPWDALHPAPDIFLLTHVWLGACGSWLMEGRGGREGGSPAGQMNGAGSAGKAKLSKKPITEGKQDELACVLTTSAASVFIGVIHEIPNPRVYPDFSPISLACPDSGTTSGSPGASGH